MDGKKVLIVIDMQNDFITGALANKEGEAIIDSIVNRIKEYKAKNLPVFFTRDTHHDNYMETQEGRKLPVPHCIEGTEGWEIVDKIKAFAKEEDILNKPSFGSLELPKWIENKLGEVPEEIELCGVCTDICVISNSMVLKAAFPETEISVSSSLCAGISPETHQEALNAMKVCQINIK